jgi:DNA mismatch repair protein MutL
MGQIHHLDPILINQIAAGEVVERPASVLKELIENAVDANATAIHISVQDGGKSQIIVTDNGEGMNEEDLKLCLERYATSKLNHGDLFAIQTLGFRGEALPSIASISRLMIQSRGLGMEWGHRVQVAGGVPIGFEPCPMPMGTSVHVEDLFFATPARLKFLKSSATEFEYCKRWIDRFALAYPSLQWSLKNGDRMVRHYPRRTHLEERLQDLFREEECQSLKPIDEQNEDYHIFGYLSLPTLNRATSEDCSIFLNGRFIRDKVVQSAIRAAYQNSIPSHRYPIVILHLSVPLFAVDINVHPAKTEVRFRNPFQIRNRIEQAIRSVLIQTASESSAHLSHQFVASLETTPLKFSSSASSSYPRSQIANRQSPSPPISSQLSSEHSSIRISSISLIPRSTQTVSEFPVSSNQPIGFLGEARCQIKNRYILTEALEGIVLIDQHAAHERLVYERLKNELQNQSLVRQTLVIPEVIPLNPQQDESALQNQDRLFTFGFRYEYYHRSLVLREVPALLNSGPFSGIILDCLEWEALEENSEERWNERLLERLATHACHTSLRSGDSLHLSEMNALLRQMEATPFSAQCNHGRPAWIKISWGQFEKLFERTR